MSERSPLPEALRQPDPGRVLAVVPHPDDDVIGVGAGVSRKLGARPGRFAFAYMERRSHPIEGREARLDLQLGASASIGVDQRSKLAGSALVGLSDTAEDLGLLMSYGRTF